MKHDNSNQNPWAGLSSYEDPAKSEQKLKFCGRDNEIKEVARLIDDNFFVTLYGKSGIGKTSLLNAGVFPTLRREQYTPLSLRLGMVEEKCTFQDVITQAIERAIEEIGGSVHVINVIDEQVEQDATDYLWCWFAHRRFVTANGQITFPVLVFDQFEEVFRHKESRRKTKVLLEQLNYLIDESHAIGDCIVDGEEYNYDFNFRFVLSIREDDLFQLEDALDNCALSALKRCRYRLHSLSEQGANEAILIPGERLFEEDEENQIAETIIKVARNKEDNSISTNLLSLVCNRLYVESQKVGSPTISSSLVDSFVKGNPFERFYNEATRGFSNKEKSYIEDHLVDSTGRRNSIPESDFLIHVKNGKKLIEGENRILQRVSTSSDGGNNRVELIHDSFCEPLSELKEKREKRKRLKWLALSSAILLLIICVLGTVLYLYLQNQTKSGRIAEQEEQLRHERDSIKQTNLRLEQLLQNLQLANKQKDCANYELERSYSQLSEREIQLLMATESMRTTQSRVLAEKANSLVDEGDSYLARLLALQALPPNRPYTVEAEEALRKASMYNSAIFRVHSGGREIFFNHKGNQILSVIGNIMEIWDVGTGRKTCVLDGHNSDICSVSYAINDKSIISTSEKAIRRWDVETGKQIEKPIIAADNERFMAISPDGKYVASRLGYDTVNISDVMTGKQVYPPFIIPYVSSLSFSPNCKYLITRVWSDTIKIFDLTTRKMLGQPIVNSKGFISSIAISPNGNYLSCSSYIYHDGSICLYETESGKIERIIKGHTDFVTSTTFSPDGKWLISASADGTVRFWDVKKGFQICDPLDGKSGIVNTVSLSKDSKYIASSSYYGGIRLWNVKEILERNKKKEEKGHVEHLCSASFSSDGNYIVSTSWDKTIRIWDAKTGEQIGKPLFEGEAVSSAAFNPNGNIIVSAASGHDTIRLWDVKSGKQIEAFNVIKRKDQYSAGIKKVSFSPDGNSLIFSPYRENTRILNLKTRNIHILKGSDYYFATFSPNGKYLVSTKDGVIRIWNAMTEEQIGLPLMGHQGNVTSVSFSSSGKYLVSTSSDKTIRIWDVRKNIQVGIPLEGHKSQVVSAAFSPDEKYVVSSSWDGTTKIWDFASGKEIWSSQGGNIGVEWYATYSQDVKEITPTGSAYSASFSHDGQYVMSISDDNTIRVWPFPPLQQIIDETRERFKDRKLTSEERQKFYLE